MKMVRGYVRLALGLVAVAYSLTCLAADYPVAGVKPDARPANAPVISSVQHDDAWHRRALTGIDAPYPPSLRFLDDQGNWYTPFNRPGMPGPYDIRGWHQPAAPKGSR